MGATSLANMAGSAPHVMQSMLSDSSVRDSFWSKPVQHCCSSHCMTLSSQIYCSHEAYFCRQLPIRPHAVAPRTKHSPRSRQISFTSAVQLPVEQDSAHREGYFGEMGRRSRKTRKRDLNNLPGRGFPHKAEEAHEAVFLAAAQEADVLALALGSKLTTYRQG